jgi:hypothetical protein
MIRLEAGLTVVRFCELAGIPRTTSYRSRAGLERDHDTDAARYVEQCSSGLDVAP